MQSGVSPVIFKQTMMRQSWCFPWNRCSSSACQPTECSPSSVCSWSSMLSCWRRLFRKQRCKTPPISSQLCLQCRAFCEIVQSFVVGGMLGWLLSCMVPFKGHVKEPRKNDWKATTKRVVCAESSATCLRLRPTINFGQRLLFHVFEFFLLFSYIS